LLPFQNPVPIQAKVLNATVIRPASLLTTKKPKTKPIKHVRKTKKMEKIEHTTVATDRINMHIASIGRGPAILFLHGFPELWYSWRHQLLSLSFLGCRCIAPDHRGYGDTDARTSVREYTGFHIVGDLIGLLNSLGIDLVFLVGHTTGGP